MLYTTTYSSDTFIGECFCENVQVLPQLCAVYYETQEYFSYADRYRTARFCFNHPPTNKDDEYHTKLSNLPRLRQLPLTDSFTWNGNCQCFPVFVPDTDSCSYYLEFVLPNENAMYNCVIINEP